MKRVLIITEGLSPTYFIRIFEPFSSLFCNQHVIPTFRKEAEVTVNDLESNDIYLFCRVRNTICLNYFYYAKLKNKKLWYDIDDFLFELPPYSNDRITKDQKENILFFIKNADIISTSTELLKNSLKEYNSSIFVLHNYINLNKYGIKNKFNNKKNTLDIALSFSDNMPLLKNTKEDFIQSLQRICTMFPNVRFHNFSNVSIDLPHDKVFYYGLLDYSSHKLFLKDYNFDLALVPLEIVDQKNKLSKFINSKSEIKYIEYAAAKIPTVFSASIVYTKKIKKGCAKFSDNSQKSWIYEINTLLKNRKSRDKIAKSAYVHVAQSFDLNKNLNQYVDILKKLETSKQRYFGKTVDIHSELELENKIYKNLINTNKLGKLYLAIHKWFFKHRVFRFFAKKIVS